MSDAGAEGMRDKPKACWSNIWVGTYHGDQLGWVAPRMIEPNGNTPLDSEQRLMLSANQRQYCPGDLYRCRITITPLKNKRGHYIVKRNKRKSKP